MEVIVIVGISSGIGLSALLLVPSQNIVIIEGNERVEQRFEEPAHTFSFSKLTAEIFEDLVYTTQSLTKTFPRAPLCIHKARPGIAHYFNLMVRIRGPTIIILALPEFFFT